MQTARAFRRIPEPWHHAWFWKAQVIGWLLYATGSFLSDFAAWEVGDPTMLSTIPFRAVRIALGFVISSGLALRLQRLPSARTHARRVGVLTVLAAAVAGSLWFPLYRIASHPWRDPGREVFSTDCLVGCLLDHMWPMLTWSMLFLAVTELQRAAEQEQARLRAERLASEARYQMLAYQVNPHFLFNALNSVRALATEDAARAREMITQLSAFLRHTLIHRPVDVVPLGAEVDTVRAYLDIEQVRHEEALQVTFDVAPEVLSARVPAFLLMPLVENAITHGFTVSSLPLRLTLRAHRRGQELVIEVTNSGTLPSATPSGMGLGLQNVRERLAHLHADRASLVLTTEQDAVVARLVLPIDLQESGS
jgi:hypothetical protein